MWRNEEGLQNDQFILVAAADSRPDTIDLSAP